MNLLRNTLFILALMSVGCTQSKPTNPIPKAPSSPQSDQDIIIVNENKNITQVDSYQQSDQTNEITNTPSVDLIPGEDIAPRYVESNPNVEGSKPIFEDDPDADTHQSDNESVNVITASPVNLSPEFTRDVENRDSHFNQIHIIDAIQDIQYIDPRNCGQDHTSPWCDYQYVTLITYNHNIVFKCYVVEDIFTKNQEGVWINSSCQVMIAGRNNIDITEQTLMIKADLQQDGKFHERTQREVDCTNSSYNIECEKLYREVERYCNYKSTDWCTSSGLSVSAYNDYTRGISIASIVDLTPRRQYNQLPTWKQVPITANELFDFLEVNQNKVRVLMDRERLLWVIKLLDTGSYNGYLWLYELNEELKNLIWLLEDFITNKKDADNWITHISNWWDSKNIEDSKNKIMYIVHLAETGDFRDESPY